MGALIWLLAAAVLAGLELLVGEFTLLMLGGAALITSGFALAHLPAWGEIIVFAIAAVGLIVFLRPVLKAKMEKPVVLDTTPRALVGQLAEVVEHIDQSTGQIRLDGSIWSARSLDPSHTFEPGDSVSVAAIDGNTAVVWKDS